MDGTLNVYMVSLCLPDRVCIIDMMITSCNPDYQSLLSVCAECRSLQSVPPPLQPGVPACTRDQILALACGRDDLSLSERRLWIDNLAALCDNFPLGNISFLYSASFCKIFCNLSFVHSSPKSVSSHNSYAVGSSQWTTSHPTTEMTQTR